MRAFRRGAPAGDEAVRPAARGAVDRPACDDLRMKHPRRWTPFERFAVGMGVGWAVVIAAIVLNVVGVLG
jgi:hypothetical protein